MFDLPPCAEDYADHYAVPLAIVEAVAEQEGGAPGVVAENGNGTVDVGVMQINSVWFEPENPVDLTARGITFERVRDEACTNIAVGVWILAQFHERMNHDWGRAIAAYNAGPNNWRAGLGYAREVIARLPDGALD